MKTNLTILVIVFIVLLVGISTQFLEQDFITGGQAITTRPTSARLASTYPTTVTPTTPASLSSPASLSRTITPGSIAGAIPPGTVACPPGTTCPITPTPGCVTPIDGMTLTDSTTFCPGNYNLPNGIRIDVKKLPFTLDCNGATIEGYDVVPFISNSVNYSVFFNHRSMEGLNIYTSKPTGTGEITIKNCKIIGYHIGILSNNVKDLVIKDNEINKSSNAIVVSFIHKGKIINNKIRNNYHKGIYAYSSDYLNIFENQISDFIYSSGFPYYYKFNHGASIELYESEHIVVKRNNLEINPYLLPDPKDYYAQNNQWDNNYYSDTSPNCKDVNNDDICDKPRIIATILPPNSIDYTPSKVMI